MSILSVNLAAGYLKCNANMDRKRKCGLGGDENAGKQII